MRLIIRIIIAIVVGILVGLYAPIGVATFLFSIKEILGQFIIFLVPLIILFFITSGIASLSGGYGITLGSTVGLAYGSTVVAASIACVIGIEVIPVLLGDAGFMTVGEGVELKSWLPIEIPPIANVMTVLVLAFLFGIGIVVTQGDALRRGFDEGKNIIERVITKLLIPILPLYIAGVFVDFAVQGTVFTILKVFGWVLGMAIGMHIVWLLILYIIAGIITGRNPFKLLYTMLPAYFTALGTMSSAATIPVTLKQTKTNGVSSGVTNFCIPLCATIHLAGSAITITMCAIAVMLLTNGFSELLLVDLLPFIVVLGVVMVAAPGVPGGAVMAALGLLDSMLGFSGNALALMIALYIAQDGFGTACNVTGDGAIALIVDRIAAGEQATVEPVSTQ